MLDKKFVEELKQAKIKDDINLVVKANAFKRGSEESVAERKKLEDALELRKKKNSKINGILLQNIPLK